MKLGKLDILLTNMYYNRGNMKLYKKIFEDENKIIVITYGGRKNFFTKDELEHMIKNPDRYYLADNLPKWIHVQSIMGSKSKFGLSGKVTFEKVMDIIKQIYKYKGDVIVNVRSDKPMLNGIEWL